MGKFIVYLRGHSRVNIYLCMLLFLGSIFVVHIIVESDRDVQKNQLRSMVLSRPANYVLDLSTKLTRH